MGKGRFIAARTLVVLGTIIAVLGIVAGYVRYQLLDTPTFRTTAEQLIADPKISDEIAATLVDQLFANVDVAAELKKRLPPDQQGLASPIAFAVRSAAESQSHRLLQTSVAQRLWTELLTRAQARLKRVLEGNSTRIDTQDGYVVLNVRPLVLRLAQRVGLSDEVNARLPEDKSVIRLLKTDDLKTAQHVTRALQFAGFVLAFIAFALWAVAVYLAVGRRRLELRAVAFGAIIAGLLTLIARSVAGRYVVDSLAGTPSGREPAGRAYDITTALLTDGAWTLIGAGVVLLIGCWYLGGTRLAVRARGYVDPYLRDPWYAYGGGALFLLLVIWWGPTAQTRRWVWLLVVTILLAIGIEVLRRAAKRSTAPAVAAPPAQPAAP